MNIRALRNLGRVGLITGVGLVTPVIAGASAHATPPSASASIADRTLSIIGSNAADNIAISVGADVNLLLIDFGNDGTVDHEFDRTAFDALDVSLGNGNDHFVATGVTVPQSSTIDGGNGDDFIVGTASADVILGGNGDDFVIGGIAHDVAQLGNGDDEFRWDPGEGSDDVDGANGDDVLLFKGAAGGETMSLSASGARAVFSRSPGNVVMNLDAVEHLDLQTFAGADSLTVEDLTGTSMHDVDVDLSASGNGGASDSQADRITVNGTDQGDHVDVVGNGTRVDVTGLPAEVHISGSSTTDGDALQISTQDGNDTVDVDAAALALIGVTTDLGAGQI